MASVVFTGFVGLGTAISNAGVMTEVSGGSYVRKALALTGTPAAGLTQALAQFIAATTPAGGTIYYGAMFDQLTGGNMLAYWLWTTSGSATVAFPAQTLNIQFNAQMAAALSLATTGGAGSSNSLIDQGAQLGTIQGQPLTAGCRLTVQLGGNLIAHLGRGTITSAIDVLGGAYVGGLVRQSSYDGLIATPSGTQTTSLLLAGNMNRVTTVATAADGVKLPPSEPGLSITIINAAAANAMQVFGTAPDTINGIATATGISQIAGSTANYYCYSAGAWTATGFSTSVPSGSTVQIVGAASGLTAHAGGGQANGLALTAAINQVGTVGTTADSVKLPIGVPGMSLIVVNAGANSMNVFPGVGDKINAVAIDTAFAMAANARIMFVCPVALQWYTLPLVAS